MNTQDVESIVAEYAANKAEADRLTARNAELAEKTGGRASWDQKGFELVCDFQAGVGYRQDRGLRLQGEHYPAHQ